MPENLPPNVLRTQRLTLRPFVLTDLDAHSQLLTDPQVTQYLPRGPFPANEVREISSRILHHFIDHWEQHGFGVWAVVHAESGALIGQCGLNHLKEAPEIEVLYLLGRAFWGVGLATEAAQAAVDYGFDVLRLHRIVGLTMPENVASQRVLEKIGLRYEKDAVFFGITCKYFARDHR